MKLDLFPSPADYPGKRLFSLDLLRGIDMFYLAVVGVVLHPLLKAVGAGESWSAFLIEHPWEGFSHYDLVMPLFIFMSGAAVPFALGSRLENGRPTATFHKHVWTRFAMLWVLGMLAQGRLESFDLLEISPYNNTLQTIAVGYVAAAYTLLIPCWKTKIAIPVLLTVAYGLIVHFGGDYTKAGNATVKPEIEILSFLLPAGNVNIENVVKHGYTWFLPSMMFPVIALSGAFSTEILRSKVWGEWRRAAYLSAFGAGSLAVGWILAFAGVRMVKHIFTVSFTLQAIGWSVLLLAALYVITDIWRLRRGTGVLLLFGQYALTAYLCKSVFKDACRCVGERALGGLPRLFPEAWQGVVSALVFSVVVVAVVVIRRKLAVAKSK